MDSKSLETLKSCIDGLVRILTCDGEVLIAKVILVSEEDDDVIYDVVSSSSESRYIKADPQPAYRITFDEIASVEAVVGSGERS